MSRGYEKSDYISNNRDAYEQQRDDLDPSESGTNLISIKSATTSKPKRKRESTLRKAPGAPKRFKSSYILFFMAQREDIKKELGSKASVGEVSKKSSEKWRRLTPDEKRIWEDKARVDKERYNKEKERYTGPWQVPWKRAKKNPNAPKRPMSAFLYFSQEKRSIIKEQNPGLKNTEISRVLGQLWKNASQEERDPHIKHERKEREKYKIQMTSWREKEEQRRILVKEKNEEEIQKYATVKNEYGERPEPVPYSISSNHPVPASTEEHYREYYSSSYPGHGYYPPPPYSQYEYGGSSNHHEHHAPVHYTNWQQQDYRDHPEDARHGQYTDDFKPIPLQHDQEQNYPHSRFVPDAQPYPVEISSHSYRYDNSSRQIPSLAVTCTSFEGDDDFGMQVPP